MKKIWCNFFSAFALALCLSGCQKGSGEPSKADPPPEFPTVELTVWGAEEDKELLHQIFEDFQAKYGEEADFIITYKPQSESSCTDALMADLEQGADVFAFADDQVAALAAAGALEPIEEADKIRTANLATSVEAASVGDTIYAYPLTADNGYFLYYNKAYFSEEDIQSLNQMVEIR